MATQPNTTRRAATSIPAMGSSINLAGAQPLSPARSQAIMAAAMSYVGKEGRRSGVKIVVDEAIADMIGASQYLKLRLGDAKARSVVSALYATMGA